MADTTPDPNVPKPAFSEEQLDAVQKIVNRTVNGTVATLKKQIADANEASKADIAKLLEEKLTAFAPKPAADDDDKGKGKRDKGDSVELQSLRKEISELRTAADRERATAAEERSKSRTMTLRSAAIDQLARIGISGNNARLALNCLLQDQRIAFDTDVSAGEVDEIVFRSDDEGWVKLDLGLKSWAKSSDAKVFLPAAGVTGAGSRPGTSPMPTAVKMSDEERKRVLGEYLDRHL
jgi:hypothetical protein